MKNKKFIAKTFLTLAMSVSMVAAGVGLAANKTVSAADGITVSSDIQAIIDGINKNGGGSFNAEYVKDYDYNGATLSGVRVTYNPQDKTADMTCLPLLVRTSDLTHETNTMGYVITTETVGEREFKNFHAYMASQDNQNYMFLSHTVDGDTKDSAANPRASTSVKISTDGLKTVTQHGLYYPNSPANNFGVRGFRQVSLLGYATTPFNFQYDATLNAIYGDKKDSDGHQTNKMRFMRALNLAPQNYSSFTDPVSGTKLSDYTGTNAYAPLSGFGNYAYLGFRCDLMTGKTSGSFILTAYAGLDLTDPQAKFTADNAALQLKGDNAKLEKQSVIAGMQTVIPEAHFSSRITNEMLAEFTGNVNIYKAARSDKYAVYGSVGYDKTAAELGAAVATVTAGSEYAFESGDYTLEYVQGDKKLYVDVTASENNEKTVVFSGTNATVDKQSAKIGDVVTVTPEAGYTLYNFGATSPSVRVTAGGVKKIVALDGNGAFTVTADMFDGDELKLEAAAYTKTYEITVFTKPAGEGDDSVSYTLYEGIPSSMYDGAYDGSGYTGLVTLSGFKFTYRYVEAKKGWRMNAATELGNFGYAVTTLGEDGAAVQSHVYKTGSAADNSFVVTGNLVIRPIRITVSAVENSAKAYLKNGNINVSMEYKIPAAQWDNFIGAASEDAGEIHVAGVFEKGEKPVEGRAGRPYNYKSDTSVSFNVDLAKVTTRTIDGVEYYIVRLECANLKIENVGKKYYFGISLELNCGNGGQVLWVDKDGNNLWTEVDMKVQVEALYSKYIKTVAPEDYHTTVTVGGTEYYSYISKASTKKLVEYYLAAQGA